MSNLLRWIVPEATKDLQLKASNPASSAWVSAHAGSGKTFVLSQRVVRLLLEGVPPSKILCLTFTKAAAANMSIACAHVRIGPNALGGSLFPWN